MCKDHWLDRVLTTALLMDNPYSVASALVYSEALLHAIARGIDTARQQATAHDRDDTAKAIRQALIDAFNDPHAA
jgi:hypothetical protein